ncbi:MAG TPA: DUF5060 domain-containing protein [Phycisphaerae bacterium]|nr:DUF5060 domain-containing protein [Phycisphaerae bacterium]HQL76206.1 DUF5060 domain-containing protein [Phycisphaerae bacterium]
MARLLSLSSVGAAVAVLAVGSFSAAAEVKLTQNTSHLMPYQVFELTFQYDYNAARGAKSGQSHGNDPNWDVVIDVIFTSPGGKKVKVGGFFYGSSRPQKPVIHASKDEKGRTRTHAAWPCDVPDLWKARYAPSETGEWTFEYAFRDKAGVTASGKGCFRVVAGRGMSTIRPPCQGVAAAEGQPRPKGWVRIDRDNPMRFVHEDGSAFYPVGWQDGVHDGNNNGSAMDEKSMEGPFRLDDAGSRPKPPPGPLFARGPSMNPVNGDVYFGRHARAGFNLWRFSPHNFSLPVFDIVYDLKNPTPARIRWEQAIMVDEMLRLTGKYGVRTFYGIFGFAKVFNDHGEDEEAMAKVKAMIKYSVDRWGAYVDFWELLNEQKAADSWYAVTIPYLKSIDPYSRPVATSWERPDLAGIDIVAPHWYGREDELGSDAASASQASRHKKAGRPVIFGEQGNGGGRPELIPQGITGVWDPGSARRMRVRLWAAMFTEISFIFWETSYAKDGHSMNIWLGPEERQYVRALQDFSARVGPGAKIVPVARAGPQADAVRAYGLAAAQAAAVYLHHVKCEQCLRAQREGRTGGHSHHAWDHDRGQVKGLEVSLDVPRAGKGYWYRPADGAILARADVGAGRQTLTAPPFDVDLALLVTAGPAPDADGDGKANDEDDDEDNDGVPDVRDAFPLEREETADADRDRIGDGMDADVDGDGRADDLNKNGVPDNEETDWDGDGVPNASAIPWDAFPRDPKEWRDSDRDGIGDNADTDDDGDGWSDEEEKRAGTDPLDATSFPR